MKTILKPLKQWTIFAALFFMASIVHAQTNSTLVLWHADGTQTRIELFKKPRIYFETWDDSIHIYSDVLDLRYPSANVLKFTYEDVPVPTTIQSLGMASTYHQEGENIYFDRNISPEKIVLYNSNGVSVPVRMRQTERGITLSLSDVPSGVYILSVNGKTSKFMKR